MEVEEEGEISVKHLKAMAIAYVAFKVALCLVAGVCLLLGFSYIRSLPNPPFWSTIDGILVMGMVEAIVVTLIARGGEGVRVVLSRGIFNAIVLVTVLTWGWIAVGVGGLYPWVACPILTLCGGYLLSEGFKRRWER